MHLQKDGPPVVAAVIGREADKLLQRFHQLEPANRVRMLDMALNLIERQEDAKLPAQERHVKRLIDQAERCMELLETSGPGKRIQRAIWRDMLADCKAELSALGISYFGEPATAAS